MLARRSVPTGLNLQHCMLISPGTIHSLYWSILIAILCNYNLIIYYWHHSVPRLPEIDITGLAACVNGMPILAD